MEPFNTQPILKYIKTERSFLKAVEEVSLMSKTLALDTETGLRKEWAHVGEEGRLNPHTGNVSLLTLKEETGTPYVFDFFALRAKGIDLEPLHQELKKKVLIAHKATFDGKMLVGEFGRNDLTWWCTLTGDQLLSNATGSKFGMARGHRLIDCVRDFLGVILTGKGTLQRDNWDLELESRTLKNPHWIEMLKYAADDTLYLFPLKNLYEKVLVSPLPSSMFNKHNRPDEECGFGMKKAVEIEMEFINPTIEMEYYGFPAAPSLIEALQLANDDSRLDSACDLAEQLGIPLDYDPILGDIPFDRTMKVFNNPKRITELLQEVGVIVGDAQKATLMRVQSIYDQVSSNQGEDDPDPLAFINEEEEEQYRQVMEFENSLLVKGSLILQTLLKYKQKSKQKGMSMLPYINPASGCVHPNVSACRASTGRVAMARPNLQQISNLNAYPQEIEFRNGSMQYLSACKL